MSKDVENSSAYIDGDFLVKVIDNSIGHYCLKLFTIFVNSFTKQMDDLEQRRSPILSCRSRLGKNDKVKFILELCERECELLILLLDYRDGLNADEDKKTHKLITYLLTKIYKLDTTTFSSLGIELGLIPDD